MSLVRALAEPGWLVLDGALGTEIGRRGIGIDTPLWGSGALVVPGGLSVNDAVHRDYAEAGATIAIANTHNASLEQCRRYLEEEWPLAPELRGLDPQGLLGAVNERAVGSARENAGNESHLAGCLMSPDRAYAAEAELSVDQIRSGLEPQSRVLDGLGLDLIIFEMLSTSSDVEGAARCMSRLSTPSAAGLTCRAKAETHGGVHVEAAAGRLETAGARLVFIHCTHPDDVTAALRAARRAVSIPVGVYANAGRRWSGDRWEGKALDPVAYAERARAWVQEGAKVVGGCCGTGPAHIRALRDLEGGRRA